MTDQEVFDKVSEHLLKQGRRSVNDHGKCLYASPSGLACAIGCLIPRDDYESKMEGMGVRDLLAKFVQVGRVLRRVRLTLLSALQDCHDNGEPACWAKDLRCIAERHELKGVA